MPKDKKLNKKYAYPINEVLGIILGGGQGTRLRPLTLERSKPAVPFAGNYRIIDIPISNCINSGVNRVFVLTQFNSASLNRHIVQTYKFDTFHSGFVDILATEQTMDNALSGFSQGTADAVRRALKHFIGYRNAKYALILSGDQLYRMNFRNLLVNHIDNNADITIGVIPVSTEDTSRFGILKMGKDYRITDFIEKPKSIDKIIDWKIDNNVFHLKKNNKPFFGSMGMYLFNLRVLEEVLTENPNMIDFGKEVIPYCINRYKAYGFIHNDYWEDIGTIKTYHAANLELTKNLPAFNFYDPDFPFFSKPRFLPPAKIVKTEVENSILSEGVIIENSKIKNSVVGIRTIIRSGTTIENSVLLGADYYETDSERKDNKKNKIPDVGIGYNCIIKNAIIEKNCRLGNNVKIINKNNLMNLEEKDYWIVDGIVVLKKNSIIPDNTIL